MAPKKGPVLLILMESRFRLVAQLKSFFFFGMRNMFKKLSCYICAFKDDSLHHSFLIVSLTIAHHLLRSKTIKAYSFTSRNKNTGTCFLRIIVWLFCPVQFIYCSLLKPNPRCEALLLYILHLLYTCVLGVTCVPEIYAVWWRLIACSLNPLWSVQENQHIFCVYLLSHVSGH